MPRGKVRPATVVGPVMLRPTKVIDWAAVSRLDDETLVNAIAQVAPFDYGAKQALLEQPTLTERADLLVQLMQFQRVALTGGVEIEPTLQ